MTNEAPYKNPVNIAAEQAESRWKKLPGSIRFMIKTVGVTGGLVLLSALFF